jgi:hypothetical protein
LLQENRWSEASGVDRDKGEQYSILTVRRLKEVDAGRYSCSVDENGVAANYTVSVHGKSFAGLN